MMMMMHIVSVFPLVTGQIALPEAWSPWWSPTDRLLRAECMTGTGTRAIT